jgi:hypothetical protein
MLPDPGSPGWLPDRGLQDRHRAPDAFAQPVGLDVPAVLDLVDDLPDQALV